MTEKERELRQRMAAKTEEIQNLLRENKLDEAEAATAELRNMKRELDVLATIEDFAAAPPPAVPGAAGEPADEVNEDHVIAQMLRQGQLTDAEKKYAHGLVRAAGNLNEGTPASGGFLVPVDAQTRINELKRALNPLSAVVRVENVGTHTGTRVLEASADITAFAAVNELATIAETDGPTFTQVTYTVNKYAGILPMSRNCWRIRTKMCCLMFSSGLQKSGCYGKHGNREGAENVVEGPDYYARRCENRIKCHARPGSVLIGCCGYQSGRL